MEYLTKSWSVEVDRYPSRLEASQSAPLSERSSMSRFQQLPSPVDLPEGTAAIVKVQQPPGGRGDHLHWIIFAEGLRHFRLYRRERLPEWVIEAMGHRQKRIFTPRCASENGVF
jgi:hypothetical protein